MRQLQSVGPRAASTLVAAFSYLRVARGRGDSKLQPSVGRLTRVPTLAATTALPYPHRDRATAGLRAALRLQAGSADRLDWASLRVAGPVVSRDARGREWFAYCAEVDVTEQPRCPPRT